MSTLNKLRRMVHRDHQACAKPAAGWASRNTAAKWLQADEMVEPRYPKRAAIPSVLDPCKEQLATWLKTDSHPATNASVVASGAMFRHCKDHGLPGLEARLRVQSAGSRRSPIPHAHGLCAHEFEMGEAFQFDWSCEYLFMGGLRKRLEAAHTKLAASRLHAHRLLQPSPRDVVRRPCPGFAAFGGVPRQGIYDNMKTAVDKVGQGKEPHRQCPLRGDDRPLPVRAGVLQPCRAGRRALSRRTCRIAVVASGWRAAERRWPDLEEPQCLVAPGLSERLA